MRLVGVSMVGDEADVIESFVRFHAQVLDHLLVVDHRSRDGTAEILAALVDEGLPLSVTREPGLGHSQARHLTELMKVAVRRHGADWVVPLDADEFLTSEEPGGVRAALPPGPPAKRYLRIPWRSYVPTPRDDPAEPEVLRRIRHRCAREPKQWYKALAPRRLAGARRTLLQPGSHDLYRGGLKRSRRYAFEASRGLALAHFPLRSVEQMERKVLRGWLASLALPPGRRPENAHWGAFFRAFARGERPDPSQLCETARRYPMLAEGADQPPASTALLCEPVVAEKEPYGLRYLELRRRPPATALLAALAEELADELGRQSTAGRPFLRRRRAASLAKRLVRTEGAAARRRDAPGPGRAP